MWDHCNDQFYIDRLRDEHARIRQAVREVENQLGAPTLARDKERIAATLTCLRQELAIHFDEADQGGCLEEAICRCPSLAHEATAIEREHSVLLRLNDRLIKRARSGRVGCESDDFVESFRCFARTLHAYEVAESRILEHAFGATLGIDAYEDGQGAGCSFSSRRRTAHACCLN